MSKTLRTLFALSIIPQVILVNWLSRHPEWIEEWYSQGFYAWFSKVFRFIFGWIPFSVGDIFYTILSLLIIRFFIVKGPLFIRSTREFFRQLFMGISMLYFVFHLFWGLNYHRLPLHEKLALSDEYTTEELKDFTQRLITKSNEAHARLAPHDSIMIKIPYSHAQIYNMSTAGYDKLKEEFPSLAYTPSSIKTSIYSLPLTYMGYSGYLNPFTLEAQVNGMQIDFKYPVVACHEAAHQLGYSAENEANFIGFMAAIHNSDPYFQYSGYIYVLRYCLGEIKRRDIELFNEMNTTINPGILKNFMEVSMFWRRYQNPAEPVFKSTFNSYLKANNQKAGIRSYSYVVALLVNYYKNRSL
ncbi:DUF3810 domain-containing protein [Robertkochia marina]|uniref:DUF3810 domain-containing protein n=1 Tax=Robertkochia marina TaxID=1227945 RepID=A0A4S3LYA1_9FLAO|nr:DUF3810 domain-containing protein [Robertkochia marina]THD66570.1 DUF3810 domain-containing protein [Robertkochia marina]TRZ45591.1 DUF3810 domain-containing protein [Robertkochia marina]